MGEIAFSADFEEKIIQAVLCDATFGEQVLEVMKPECFELSWTKEITKQLIQYYSQYKKFPSISLLKNVLENEIKDNLLKKECFAYLKKISDKPLNGDSDYIKDKSLSYFRKQYIQNALINEVVPKMKTAELDDILPIIQNALNKGTNTNIGYSYHEDEEYRFIEEDVNKVPTPWPILNEMLRGGWEGKRISTIIGASGAGKSFFLVNVSAGALLAGKTVVHYTLELSDIDVARRIDAAITGIEINEISKNKSKVLFALKNKLPKNAKLIIKEYPMKSASIQTIKGHLSKLQTQNIKPDIIVIDYGDLLSSMKEFSEERHGLSSIWMNMKTLAQEMNIPIVTATQTNRAGAESEVIRATDVSEDFKKVMHSDILLTLARNSDQKKTGIGKILLAKNRQGQDGQIIAYTLDTARSNLQMFELTEDVQDQIEERLTKALAKQSVDNASAADAYLKKIKGNV